MIKRAYIEITNSCNLQCAFCARSSRAARFMSVTEFQQVAAQVKPYTSYIYLHVQGEPLMHPDLDDILSAADRLQLHVQLVTNGSLIRSRTGILTHPSLRKVSFSLHRIDYQKTGAMDYLQPVLDFCRTASSAGHPFCELRFWLGGRNMMPKSQEILTYLQTSYAFQITGRFHSYEIMPHVYVSMAEEFAWPSLDSESVTASGTCLGGLQQIAVLSDGTVVPCCLDKDGIIALGNCLKQPLSAILESDRLAVLQKGFKNGRVVEPLCQHCTYRCRFSKTNL